MSVANTPQKELRKWYRSVSAYPADQEGGGVTSWTPFSRARSLNLNQDFLLEQLLNQHSIQIGTVTNYYWEDRVERIFVEENPTVFSSIPPLGGLIGVPTSGVHCTPTRDASLIRPLFTNLALTRLVDMCLK